MHYPHCTDWQVDRKIQRSQRFDQKATDDRANAARHARPPSLRRRDGTALLAREEAIIIARLTRRQSSCANSLKGAETAQQLIAGAPLIRAACLRECAAEEPG